MTIYFFIVPINPTVHRTEGIPPKDADSRIFFLSRFGTTRQPVRLMPDDLRPECVVFAMLPAGNDSLRGAWNILDVVPHCIKYVQPSPASSPWDPKYPILSIKTNIPCIGFKR
jgi:hypothetical protein